MWFRIPKKFRFQSRLLLLRKIAVLFFLLLPFVAFQACGKKAPPIAPRMTIPAPVSDLQAYAKEEGIFLRWTMPAKNIDESRLADLLGFRVFRQESSLSASSCAECSLRFEAAAEIDVEYPRGPVQITEDKVLWRDAALKAGRQYRYFVVAYNAYHTPSPESNRITVAWDQPPGPPADLRVRSDDGALELSWSYVPAGSERNNLAGFNIYRRTDGERFSFFPLNPQPVPGREYLDGGLENGRRYDYQVRAVRNFRGTPIEGVGSPIASGVPEKRTPPSAPTGLTGARQEEGVALRWTGNAEPDVAGYHVYRGETGQRESRQVNPQLITVPYFLDTSAEPQKSYEYSVTAVNAAGKESGSSQKFEIGPTGSEQR